MEDNDFILYVMHCAESMETALEVKYKAVGSGLGKKVKDVENQLPNNLRDTLWKKIIPTRNKVAHKVSSVPSIGQADRIQFIDYCEYCMRELGIPFNESFFQFQSNKENTFSQSEPEQFQHNSFKGYSNTTQHQIKKYNKSQYFSYHDCKYDNTSQKDKNVQINQINNRMFFGVPGLIKKALKMYKRRH
ncbi:MAG: hypothetical protein HOC71_14615 [Candidatus Latescibacteria bacterium]|jgi:hypothetical protein|nr:hypothetical protein [Candidatus Latescibacterota bacterium]